MISLQVCNSLAMLNNFADKRRDRETAHLPKQLSIHVPLTSGIN